MLSNCFPLHIENALLQILTPRGSLCHLFCNVPKACKLIFYSEAFTFELPNFWKQRLNNQNCGPAWYLLSKFQQNTYIVSRQNKPKTNKAEKMHLSVVPMTEAQRGPFQYKPVRYLSLSKCYKSRLSRSDIKTPFGNSQGMNNKHLSIESRPATGGRKMFSH